MKKLLLIVLTVALLTLTLCSCGNSVLPIDEAEVALEDAGYKVEAYTPKSPKAGEPVAELCAAEKQGLSASELADIDGDGFFAAKNQIMILYFEDDAAAEDAFNKVEKETLEFIEELLDDGDIDADPGFEIDQIGSAIVIGTADAIDIVS